MKHSTVPDTERSFDAVPINLEGAPCPGTNLSGAGRCCLFHPPLPFLLFGWQPKDTGQEDTKQKQPDSHPDSHRLSSKSSNVPEAPAGASNFVPLGQTLS